MTVSARTAVDPHAVICELVAAVEPDLPPGTVHAAIDQAVRFKAAAVRLAQVLDGDPGLLTSGRAEGPASVERLIRLLQEGGAVRVVRPPCALCGKLAPLTGTYDSGLRICHSCGNYRTRAKGWACMACGNGETPRYGLDRFGREVCRACFKADCTEDPAADLLSHMSGLGLDQAVLQTVIAEVTEGKTTTARRLLWDLQNQPGLLAGQAPHHSPRTVLLAYLLHKAGAEGVPAPKCPHCDRAVRLTHSIKRMRVCGTCYNRSKAEPCKWCGRHRPVAGRDDAGAPICITCRREEPAYQEKCSVCGRLDAVAARTADGPLCSVCLKPRVVQCGSCGKLRSCMFAKTDSPRCRACSRKLEPCIDCGRASRVTARTARGPVCENCWEKAPEAHRPCQQCGVVERLFHFGLCRRCAGERQLRTLLTPPNGTRRPELDKVAAALLDLNPRRTLLYLRESATAGRLVIDLAAGACELSHEALDARLSHQHRDLAVEYFRAVLVSAGILPVRDEYLARLERWIEQKTAAIEDPEDRRLITAFARWDRIARIRRRARGNPISSFTSDIAQTQIAKAITFLNWIKGQEETLATCRQPLIDLWLTSEDHRGPYVARPFVRWAVRSKFATNLSIPGKPQRTYHRPLDADERWATARRLLNDDSIETRDRVAGLMVLLYGQFPAKTCRLTVDHVVHNENGVALRLNTLPLKLQPPMDGLVLQLVDLARGHERTVISNEHNAPWLFPSLQMPGRPMTSQQLGRRLRTIGLPSEAGRSAALLDLCAQIPPGVLQRLLGISPAAAARWSAGAVRTAYAAEVALRSDG
ncbi:site-specific integrase (plasmid) [Streptomyces sp. NBC_00868]|uniref:hypothetical protein n=1 Tax=Streptomyces sp. NBC_00868 TaxID=2903683 RepID=UPI0038643EB3|nr:site-specific integrase [Streptomyces sp. NBC_00868]